MASGIKNMTQGSPWRQITLFAVPIFLSQLFQQLYNTADSLIVGKFLGTDALAAVSSSGTLIFLIISFFNGATMGASVVISRYFGAGDNDKVDRAIHTSVAVGLVCGVFLTAFGVGLTPTFLRLMGTDPDVLPDAIIYFRHYFLGSVAIVMYNTCKSIMNALGDSRHPLYYLIFSSVLNIILDIVFIGVFKMGVWSAAFATTLSQALSFVLCLIHLCRKDGPFPLVLRKIRFSSDVMKEIVRYGFPSGVQNSVIGLANVIVQTNINSFGKLAMAAYGSYAKIEGFAFLPITSFTMALTTFTGQNLGAGEHERAKKGSRFGIVASVLLAESIGVLTFVFAPTLVGMFSDDPGVVAFGVLQCRIEALFYCLLAYSHAIASIFRGAGKAFVPMAIMLAVWCVLRICYITVIMHVRHEIRFIYWAYPLTWGISSVIYFFYYRFSDWVHSFDKTQSRDNAVEKI